MAQVGKIPDLEQQAKRVETELAGLLKERRQMESQSDSLAKDLAGLKSGSGGGTGIFSRYKLEAKLKESQKLSGRLQECESMISKARIEYGKLAVTLEKQYSNEINNVLKNMNRAEDKALSDYLHKLYSQRNIWREKVPERSSGALILFKVTLDSMDGSREIEEKADLLKDMEEEVRVKHGQMLKKVSDLREEKKIREKMGDFLQEISLFGDRERGRSGGADDSKRSSDNIEMLIGSSVEQFLDSGPGGSATAARDQTFRFWETIETLDPANISSENINQIIDQYLRIIELLGRKAEELNENAAVFYKKAGASVH